MSAFIKSTKHPSRVGMASIVGLALTSLSVGNAVADKKDSLELDAISVDSTVQKETFKADKASSHKFGVPLLDTPKSITIINEKLIEERAAHSLKDVLRTTPGITLGSGEGGTPVGDRPFIRGYEASTDLMIDGVRDVGRTSHEIFNIEQVEVIKGPSSTYAGRGSTGGTINLSTKSAKQDDFIHGSVTLGTDSLWRNTIDINQYSAEHDVAFRLNAMKHKADTPGRDDVFVKRWGFAPTITWGLNGPTRVNVSYYHLKNDDMPDLGHPISSITYKPVKVDRDNFYGLKHRDFSRSTVDQAAFVIEHDLNEFATVKNTTRVGRSTLDYVMTRPSFGTLGTQGAIDLELQGKVLRDGRGRNSATKTAINQTDIYGEFRTGSINHIYSSGLEFSRENYDIRSRYAFKKNEGNYADLEHPHPGDGFAPVERGADTHAHTKQRTKSFYVVDTLQLNPNWDLNLGLRYDDFHVSNKTDKNHSRFWNYQAGIVYKPAKNGSIYLTYNTSSNPAGETAAQSGGADGAGAAGTIRDLQPEKNRSLELGTKWALFDEQLELTAAVFRTEKTNARSQDPLTGDVTLSGNTRVTGFELGANGNITEDWRVWSGYTYMNPKIKKYRSGGEDFDGNQMKFIAKKSFSAWTSYDITEQWTVGAGANYMGSRYLNDANTVKFDPYWRYDAMVGYKVNKNFDLQLNVLNLANKTIYDASHAGIFANVAPGRSAELTANFKF